MKPIERRALRPAALVRERAGALPVVARWYLGLAWGLFLVIAVVDFSDRRELADPFGYSIGDLGGNLPRAVAVLPVATFVNVGVLQILYVTAILGVVGPRLAVREERVVAAVFLGTSVFAGLAAGVALYAIDGQVSHRIVDEAWERQWNGGSAGCYGLVGFVAAGSRRPWLMLVLAGAWEIGLTGIHLHSYTPAFHVSALLAGFAVGRWVNREAVGERAATGAVG